MKFFEDKYIKSLKAKEAAGTLKKEARPAFRLATDSGFENYRNDIDEFYSSLSESSRDKLRRKRNDLENIFQTINEIRVGNYFQELGFTTEMDKDFDGLTPDWFVTSEDGKWNFMVEVFTKTIPDELKLENEYLEDLKELSRNSSIGALIGIDINDKLVWNDEFVQKLYKAISSWLSEKPKIKESIVIEEVSFTLLSLKKAKGVAYIGPLYSVRLREDDDLEKKIIVKIDKYKDICKKSGLPFVVACLPSLVTNIQEDDMTTILFGAKTVDVNGKEIEKAEGIFDKYKELSVVLAFLADRFYVFHNPFAELKLLEDTFV